MKSLLISWLSRHPFLKHLLRNIRNRLFPGSAVSAHYVTLEGEEKNTEALRLVNAWQSDLLPQRQRDLVEAQLHKYRAGARIDVFDVFVQSVRALPQLSAGMSLLEIGCSSGFYSEVLHIAGLGLTYTGCDYSDAFIQLAREKYPTIAFDVEDATALRYPQDSFDVVVSGCCLLHIPQYAKAIEETARVARSFAIFHRTPVVWGQSEQWFRKQAYGVETVEIHFNEPALLQLFAAHGLHLIETHTLHEEKQDTSGQRGHAVRTYVLSKHHP